MRWRNAFTSCVGSARIIRRCKQSLVQLHVTWGHLASILKMQHRKQSVNTKVACTFGWITWLCEVIYITIQFPLFRKWRNSPLAISSWRLRLSSCWRQHVQHREKWAAVNFRQPACMWVISDDVTILGTVLDFQASQSLHSFVSDLTWYSISYQLLSW